MMIARRRARATRALRTVDRLARGQGKLPLLPGEPANEIDRSLDKLLVLPEGVSEKTFCDDDLRGFGVRIGVPAARKSFVVQYKVGRQESPPRLGPRGGSRPRQGARLRPRHLGQGPIRPGPRGRAASGAAQGRETAFGALLPRYIERQAGRLKPRSLVEARRHLEAHAKPLHGLAVESIDRRTLAILLGKIAESSGPFAANRVRASLSAFFMWLMREGITETNLVLATNKAVEAPPRDRVISDAELAQIWNALDDGPYSAIVRLLMLTGARREEIGGLNGPRSTSTAPLIVLPGARTKTGRVHRIPLVPIALATITAQPRRMNADGTPRDSIFGRGDRSWKNWSASKDELDARIDPPIPGWRLHDFRRSLSTALHERFDVQPHVVESASRPRGRASVGNCGRLQQGRLSR